MNKVTLIGRLTRDAEMSYASNSNNTAIARYTLAVNRQYKPNGNQEADFLRCVAFGKVAEIAEKHLRKGMQIAVEGHIQTGSYVNREGQKIHTTDIIVERQEFLGKKADNSRQPDQNPAVSTDTNNYDANGFMDIPDMIDENLPFV